MEKEQQMYFFIADISGYTNYMITNNVESEHAKLTLTLLIKSVVKTIEFPLLVSKLEGDAIFLYLTQEVKDPFWLTTKIFKLFEVFERKVHALKLSTTCSCGGCVNIDKLQLKVITHYGKATISKIGHFKELCGVDVIILHRLLKNHVPSHRYLLLTQAAYEHMQIPETILMTTMEEHYDDVGTIPIYVCYPPPLDETALPLETNFVDAWKHKLFMRFRKKIDAPYRNLPKPPSEY
jgi:hypothetical protein